MSKTFIVATVALMRYQDPGRAGVPAPLDERLAHLAGRLKREMCQGRDAVGSLLPGVTIRWLAFYRECPDRN